MLRRSGEGHITRFVSRVRSRSALAILCQLALIASCLGIGSMPALAQNDTPIVAVEIHNAAHTPVTTVLSGDSVHAKATVTGNNEIGRASCRERVCLLV